jgi:hypothetical protein
VLGEEVVLAQPVVFADCADDVGAGDTGPAGLAVRESS